MDILELIDRVDDVVREARSVPLTDQVRVDREALYALLDEVRASIPEEVKHARWIVKERQEMIAETQRECERLIADARDQAAREVAETTVTRIADRQAAELLDAARRAAREVRLVVEDWADGTLTMLERNLEKFLAAARRGQQVLREHSSEEAIVIEGDRQASLG